MKTFGVFLCVLAIGVIAAAQLQAIASGPGGRLYLTQRVTAGSTMYVRLLSIPIGTNWAGGALVNHGDIVDNSNGTGTYAGWAMHLGSGLSPEVETPGGGAYGTLVMGLYYNNTPKSVRQPTDQTLDLVRVTPSAGSLSTTLLGDGRASAAVPGTESGIVGLPNPTINGSLNTQFTGASNRYIISSNYNNWRGEYNIVYNSNPGADCDATNDVADYAVSNIQGVWAETDFELHRDRLYATSAYNAVDPNIPGDGVFYIKNTGGVYTAHQFFNDGLPAVLPAMDYYEAGGCAVGEVRDKQGQTHDAAWGSASSAPDPYPYNRVALFADLNGDGDAMDNSQVAGTGGVMEYRVIYTDASSTVPGDDPGWTSDFELLRNDNGTQFLMILNSNPNVIIIQLADNGEFAGKGQVNPNNYVTVISTGIPYGVGDIEFDSQLNVPVPEPATLLLLGTSALGVMGCIRRRRMT